MASSSSPPYSSPLPAAASDDPPPDVQNARIPLSLQGLPGMLHGARWPLVPQTSTDPNQRTRRRPQKPAKAQIVGSAPPQTRRKPKTTPRRKTSPSGSGNCENVDSAVHHVPLADYEARATRRLDDVAGQLPMKFEQLAVEDTLQRPPLDASPGPCDTAGQRFFAQADLVGASDVQEGTQWTCSTPSSTTTTNFEPETPPVLDDAEHHVAKNFSDIVPQQSAFPNMGPHHAQGLGPNIDPGPLEDALVNVMYNINMLGYGDVGNGGAANTVSGSDLIPGQGFGAPLMPQVDSPSSQSEMVFQCPREQASASAYVGVGMEDNNASFDPLFSPESLTDTHDSSILPFNRGLLYGLDTPFLDNTFTSNTPLLWNNGRDQNPVLGQPFDGFSCACHVLYDPMCPMHGGRM